MADDYSYEYDDQTRRQPPEPRPAQEDSSTEPPPDPGLTRRARRIPARPGGEPPFTPPPPPPQQPPPPPERGRRRAPRGSALYVPWWVFVVVILMVAAITCGMWYLVLANRGNVEAAQGPTPTVVFVVITPTPTLGSVAVTPPAGIVTAAPPTATPTDLPPAVTAPSPSGDTDIVVGSKVEIYDTDGAGLSVRQGPGVDFTFFFIAQDGEEFLVEDGPRRADGYTWWYLQDEADPDRAGWAVEDFMLPLTP